jgi:hypothetical protein
MLKYNWVRSGGAFRLGSVRVGASSGCARESFRSRAPIIC